VLEDILPVKLLLSSPFAPSLVRKVGLSSAHGIGMPTVNRPEAASKRQSRAKRNQCDG